VSFLRRRNEGAEFLSSDRVSVVGCHYSFLFTPKLLGGYPPSPLPFGIIGLGGNSR
jgi:hypothetical protein